MTRVRGHYIAGTRLTDDPTIEENIPFTTTEAREGRARLLVFLKRNLRPKRDSETINDALDEAGIIKNSRNTGGHYGGRSVSHF